MVSIVVTSCSLEEHPPFLANETLYTTGDNATAALKGMYSTMVGYNYYGNDYMMLTVLNSGFGVTKRGGNTNAVVDNITLGSLKAISGGIHLGNSWNEIYRTIGRANDVIVSAKEFPFPVSTDELVINDVIGHAYFMRAFNYFNLVRLWGEVPLRIEPASPSTINLAKSSIKDIYTQIIADVKKAQELMNDSVGEGMPRPQAADMLLAKVYMTLATAATEVQTPNTNYWQLAYDEAIKVYGEYSLLPSYNDLFNDTKGNNTTESIFEIQSSELASLDHARAFTPSNYVKANTFGWLKINAEAFDLHRNTYPDDERISTTYLTLWTQQNNGNESKTYPNIPWGGGRPNFNVGFPYLLKIGSTDIESTLRVTNKNFKIYRYADLLLMLAEISNELQNGEQLGYVTEVLDRVGITPPAAYSGDKETFRNAIMKEYQFELMGEAHGWFNNRRRGYDYFLNNIIIPHNTASTFIESVDVTFDTDETSVMYLPIPSSEINTNELIDN